MAVYDDIRAALETQLANTVGVPSIAWENIQFNPITGTPYIKAKVINTARRPAVRGLNPQYRYQGVLQLLLCYPEGVGPSASQGMVNTLIDRFPTGSDLVSNGTYVTIEYAEQMGSYNDSPWFKTPVNIHWFSYNN